MNVQVSGVQAELAQGPVQGLQGEVLSFLGVPYAAPLTPENRFLPPQPVPPQTETFDATRFGPVATQNFYNAPFSELFVEPHETGDEQLNLNIWTADMAGTQPVLVWIHGGAYTHGAGSVPQYDGSSFARSGIVCVTLNYRLGVEGFLDLGGDDTANVGLRDQLAALRWVQDNIAQFGGDPSRVTVAGQSAGAMSIGALLSSSESSKLFRSAILQSGAAHHTISRDTARTVAEHLATKLDIPLEREAFAATDPTVLLRELAALEAEIQTEPDFATFREAAANMMPFSPTVDGAIVPRQPLGAIAQGSARDIPLLLGTTRDENYLFLAASGTIDYIDDATLRGTVQGFGFTDADAIIDLYQREDRPGAGHTMAAVLTDWMFRIPAIRLAESQSAAGGAPTYMYEFDWRSTARDGVLNACHSSDIPFFFNSLDSAGAERLTGAGTSQELADETHSAWIRFIADGDPGWAPYTPDSRTVHRFAEPSEDVADPRSAQREAWTGLR